MVHTWFGLIKFGQTERFGHEQTQRFGLKPILSQDPIKWSHAPLYVQNGTAVRLNETDIIADNLTN